MSDPKEIALLRERAAPLANAYGTAIADDGSQGAPTALDVRIAYTQARDRHQFAVPVLAAIEDTFARFVRDLGDRLRSLDSGAMHSKLELKEAENALRRMLSQARDEFAHWSIPE